MFELKSFRSLTFFFLNYFYTIIRVKIKPIWQTSLVVFRSLPILWSSLLDGILHAVCHSGWTWKGRSFSFLLRQSKAFDSLLISSLRNAYTRGFSVELAKFNKRNASISCLEGTRRFKETQIMLLITSPQHEMNMITSTVINLTIDLQMSCDMGEFSHFLSLPYINIFIKSLCALKRRKLL